MRHDIVVFTGSRADFSLLLPLITRLESEHNVTVLASGGHLQKEQGYTINTVKESVHTDVISADIALDNDKDLTHIISHATRVYGDILSTLKCTLFIVLGDRYEAFAAAIAANLKYIPILHLHGGEETLGAQDNYFRNCITKLSAYHFVSCERYRQRVIQMGEHPSCVFNTGAIGLYNVHNMQIWSKERLYQELGLAPDDKFFLITLHPETMSDNADYMVMQLLEALDNFKDYRMIFTAANADTGGDIINAAIQKKCAEADNCNFFYSLGILRYINAMRYACAIIGNSSSALIEAPSLNAHIIDIGQRQAGRVRADCVISCKCSKEQIKNAIDSTLLRDDTLPDNPYYKEDTVAAMCSIIASLNTDNIMQKAFYDLKE